MPKTETIENGKKTVRDSDEYKKSNSLVSAKYKSTLVENKILALSLSKANKMIAEYIEVEGEDEPVKVYTSVLKSSEIKNALGISSKNMASQMKTIYDKMSDKKIGMTKENGDFGYRNLVIGGDYSNGELKLYYNPLLSSYYKEVSRNYTMLSLSTMMKFKSVHSFRLYELLKKECYTNNNKPSKPSLDTGESTVYFFNYSVAELKLMIGVVNAESAAVKNILNKNGDFEKAVEKAEEKGFERWCDFKRRCIDPAILEINDLTEMQVTYSLKKSGQGGKVHAIEFAVEINNGNLEKPATESKNPQIDEDIFFDEVSELIEEKIRFKDIKSISEAAGYDIEKIKKAYRIAKQQKSVDNLVGFMISAIANDYTENISISKKQTSGSFGDFMQSGIDYEELEKKIYAN